MRTESQAAKSTRQGLTVGDGIAIASIWLAYAAILITLLIRAEVWQAWVMPTYAVIGLVVGIVLTVNIATRFRR